MGAPPRPLIPHRFARMFPEIDAKTFQLLTKGMRENGFKPEYPIVLYNGMILDGRNRYRAAQETKTAPVFRDFEGDDSEALQFVVSANLHRRHLNISEKAIIAAELLDIEAELSANEKSVRKFAQTTVQSKNGLSVTLGISPRAIDHARELKQIDRDAFEAIKASARTMQRPGAAKRDKAPRTVSGALKKAKAVIARREAPPEPVAPTDDAGHPIHPRATDALNSGRAKFRAIINALHALKRDALALTDTDLGRHLHRQSIETDFENIARQLRFAAPYSSCPLNDPCGEGCKLCRGTQWISESQYAGMPTQFKKKVG